MGPGHTVHPDARGPSKHRKSATEWTNRATPARRATDTHGGTGGASDTLSHIPAALLSKGSHLLAKFTQCINSEHYYKKIKNHLLHSHNTLQTPARATFVQTVCTTAVCAQGGVRVPRWSDCRVCVPDALLEHAVLGLTSVVRSDCGIDSFQT